jgi:ABC-type lipoprotein release transport system permease subunit
MNKNFTYLRNCICVLILSVAFTNSFSQNSEPANTAVSNLKASIENNRIIINWNTTDAVASNYCEVQASADGKTFSTIGLVMGADPKQTDNSFIFKQELKKMKPGHSYYRILTVDGQNRAYASNVIKAAK